MRMPEGITDRHASEPGWLGRHASPLSFVILALFLGLALLGFLGGQPHPVERAESAGAAIEVAAPRIIRNGEFFEMRIRVDPRRPISNLVIGVEPSLWRDLTVNSMVPAASEENYEDGAFRFAYGPAERGKPLVVKIDFQINPPMFGGTAGRIIVYDDMAELVALPLAMKVRP